MLCCLLRNGTAACAVAGVAVVMSFAARALLPLLRAAYSVCERIIFALCPDFLLARYKAASFLIRMSFDIYPDLEEQGQSLQYQTKLATSGENVPRGAEAILVAKVFPPARHGISPATRTILVVHGFADSGFNDARIVNVSRALGAASGAIVVLPHFPQLVGCRLSDESVASIRSAIEAIASDSILCPSGSVSVAAVCVCAGLSILASADAGSIVEAILGIGAFADLLELINYCTRMEGKGDSCYGINAALSNFWNTEDPAYREIFLTELRDDHYLRKGKPDAERPKLHEKYPKQNADFLRLYSDPAFLEHAMRSSYARHEAQAKRLSLSSEKLKQLHCSSITLVHAAVDEIIPPSESVAIYERLVRHTSVPASLCITTLLNHGDKQKLGIRSVSDMLRLIDGFSLFFRCQKLSSGYGKSRG